MKKIDLAFRLLIATGLALFYFAISVLLASLPIVLAIWIVGLMIK